jgi:enoyl-CoA hydratase
MSSWSDPGSFKYLLIEQPFDAVALIRLNRPGSRNALNIALRREIARAVATADQSPEIGAIILAGAQDSFASGGDIKENSTLGPVDTIYRIWEKRSLWRTVSTCRKPIVAAIRGYALGGGAELMMLADVIIASRTARIGQLEVTVGIIPGSGGTQRLTKAVGKFSAMKILLTGRSINGAEASRKGLVSEAGDDMQVEARAIEIATTIANNAPLATSFAKESVLIADDCSLDVGLALEHKSFLPLLATNDFKTGLVSFLNKKQARFSSQVADSSRAESFRAVRDVAGRTLGIAHQRCA